MLMPTDCPICHTPLQNQFNRPTKFQFGWEKFCNKKIDHNFYCGSETENNENVFFLKVSLGSNLTRYINWIFPDKYMYISNLGSKEQTNLPFIEPDFSDFKKLVKKIKTCLLLS